MASDLELKIKHEKHRVLITWKDTLNNHASRDLVRNILVVLWGVIAVVSVISVLASPSLTPLIWLFGGLVCVFVIPQVVIPAFVRVPRFVSLTKTSLKSGFGDAPIQDISRIDYGLRGVWDKSDKDRENRTQVRAWVRDEYSFILAENDWNTDVNHKLRDVFSKALADAQDREKQQENIQEFGEVSNDTGMPDY